jgi:hypothetical protein
MTRHLALVRDHERPFSILDSETRKRDLSSEEKCLYLFIRIDRMVMPEVREGARSKVVNQVQKRADSLGFGSRASGRLRDILSF